MADLRGAAQVAIKLDGKVDLFRIYLQALMNPSAISSLMSLAIKFLTGSARDRLLTFLLKQGPDPVALRWMVRVLPRRARKIPTAF